MSKPVALPRTPSRRIDIRHLINEARAGLGVSNGGASDCLMVGQVIRRQVARGREEEGAAAVAVRSDHAAGRRGAGQGTW